MRTRLLADGTTSSTFPPVYSTNSTYSGDSNENEYSGGGGLYQQQQQQLQSMSSYESEVQQQQLQGVAEPNILQVRVSQRSTGSFILLVLLGEGQWRTQESSQLQSMYSLVSGVSYLRERTTIHPPPPP